MAVVLVLVLVVLVLFILCWGWGGRGLELGVGMGDDELAHVLQGAGALVLQGRVLLVGWEVDDGGEPADVELRWHLY